MEELADLEKKMRSVMGQLKETLDLSLEVKNQNPSQKARIEKYWEDFLIHLLEYIKKKEKESGEDLIKKISFTKLFKLLR